MGRVRTGHQDGLCRGIPERRGGLSPSGLPGERTPRGVRPSTRTTFPSLVLTLGLDTTTDVCAIALLDGSTVTFEASLDVPRSHGRRLAPLLREAFGHVGREPSDLGLVAVSAGPGSFTGLRIGMSTAKGLVLSTGASIVAVSTLRALAASGHGS